MLKKVVILGGVVLVWRELKRYDEHGSITRFAQDVGGEVVAGCGIMLGYGLTGAYKATQAICRLP